ncbi:unnamed protein product [Coffea canephora]|uniref:DUF1442 domain-containing protein n=2 Tax=Coffea TaxID=13442 RepID=A0A068TQT4_COFCA|nr:unnamed protein product [Coffea canephora]
MKLIWCPEISAKAYIDTVKFCGLSMESSAPELISAMAGGWNAKLIVEAWTTGGAAPKNSIGLAIAARHSGGRHVCIVADEKSRQEYTCAMQNRPAGIALPEVMVGEAEELMGRLTGIDFLVVDGHCKDFTRVFSFAKFSHLGAVLVCKNASRKTFSWFRWNKVLDSAVSVVNSRNLPIGNGIDVAYVAGEKRCSGKVTKGWITHMDQQSGEEHVFRR